MGRIKDLVGEIFGSLVVVGQTKDKNNHTKWIGECACGTVKLYKKQHLIRMKGCTECRVARTIEDLTGRKFGRLTVIKFHGIIDEQSQWVVNCDCGTQNKIVPTKRLVKKIGATRSCGCLRRESAQKARSLLVVRCGPESNFWNPQLTKEERLSRKNNRNRDTELLVKQGHWRKRVFEKDGYVCQISGTRGGDINAHHIFNWADHAEIRFDANNGITLSAIIHRLFHKEYGKRRNNDEQLEEFKKRYKSGEFDEYLKKKCKSKKPEM